MYSDPGNGYRPENFSRRRRAMLLGFEGVCGVLTGGLGRKACCAPAAGCAAGRGRV